MKKRVSVAPTYNRSETGDRFSVETRVNDRLVSVTFMPDPFMHHRVTFGWRDLFRGLLRGLEVTVVVSGDPDIVEDVSELDADYLGQPGSSRRQEWDARVDAALRRV